MATNFSPSMGVLCFKPIPRYCNVGMKGFYVSASGAIQGHHGRLVFKSYRHLLHLSVLKPVQFTPGRYSVIRIGGGNTVFLLFLVSVRTYFCLAVSGA